MSVREASRVFGLHRDTVRKMLAYSVPLGCRRQILPRRPKLEPFTGVVDAILEADVKIHRKQRHTARRFFERSRDEYGFDARYNIVKDYVRERWRAQEMFVPLSHAPSHAQCDFGEAVAIVGGVGRKEHYFVLDLSHSDGCFVKADPAETTEEFLDGHVSACAFLGGAPQSIRTTIPDWRWSGYRATGTASAFGRSPSCSPTICSRTGSDVPAGAMTRGKSRAWWATRGATSWCRRPGRRVSQRSMLTWSRGAWSGWTPRYADIPRPSASGWSGT